MSTQAHIANTLGVFNFTHDSALNNTVTKPQETVTNIFFCWETDIGMDQRSEGKNVNSVLGGLFPSLSLCSQSSRIAGKQPHPVFCYTPSSQRSFSFIS